MRLGGGEGLWLIVPETDLKFQRTHFSLLNQPRGDYKSQCAPWLGLQKPAELPVRIVVGHVGKCSLELVSLLSGAGWELWSRGSGKYWEARCRALSLVPNYYWAPGHTGYCHLRLLGHKGTSMEPEAILKELNSWSVTNSSCRTGGKGTSQII